MREPIDDIATIHAEVDRDVRRLTVLHAERLACRRGCHQCCVDELTVFEVEATAIRDNYQSLLRDGQPHPVGACAFLDEQGACRIYHHRPYVCRTQGLPLRWLVQGDTGDAPSGATIWVEHRDICSLNDHGTPLEKLAPERCWTLGPYEGRLATLQARTQSERARIADRRVETASIDERLERVALRDLFARFQRSK